MMYMTIRLGIRLGLVAALALFTALACGGGSDCEKAGQKLKTCFETACKNNPGSLYCQKSSGSSSSQPDQDNTCDGANLEAAKQYLSCNLDPNTCGCVSSGGSSNPITSNGQMSSADPFGNLDNDAGTRGYNGSGGSQGTSGNADCADLRACCSQMDTSSKKECESIAAEPSLCADAYSWYQSQGFCS